ncbi:MAG: ferritin-like domain-containing protein [Thermoleophilaceae bacterium]|nr:ferritin-like domain-containing protein [Thermoleophilaceae bacterium]
MNEAGINNALQAVDRAHAGEPAATRRQLVAGAAATLGGLGLLGLPAIASAQGGTVSPETNNPNNNVQNILNIAATAEVLATIVNTVGFEEVGLEGDTKRNVRAAAREELIHYDVLTAALGASPLAKRIFVPDAVFASEKNLLETLVVGDQIFINAYMIATTVFGDSGPGGGKNARIASEFMGAEAVHRALARQSLKGLLGNDRVFMKYDQPEEAKGPGRGMPGFTDINVAVAQLQGAGFGFGERGKGKGTFYEFDEVRRRTPNPSMVNTREPR